MNSIDRVKRALRFQKPDLVPIWKSGLGDVLPLPMLPSKKWRPGYSENERGIFPFVGDDVVIKWRLWKWSKPDWARDLKYKNWLPLKREEVDELGIIWNREGDNRSMGHPGRPALADWANYEKYISQYSPDPYDPTRYSLGLKLAKFVGRNKYRMGLLGFQGPFTNAHSIRGFESFMIDHFENPDALRELLRHVTEFFVNSAKAWVKFGAKPHGFALYDDLADQRRPFISPKMFREFYEPVFKTIFDAVHELGCEIHLHSCGNVVQLIPILMEWGVDALQFDSPRMNGYPDLEPFRGKIMMWGDVNIQTIYPNGTPEEVEREVWHMVRNMGTPEGGFGAYFYPQVNHINVPKANIKAFAQGLKKFGDYSKIPPHWWTEPIPKEWRDNAAPPLPE